MSYRVGIAMFCLMLACEGVPEDRADRADGAPLVPEADAGEAADAAPGSSEEPDAGADPGSAPPIVRFVMVGDTGTGKEAQHAVADAMAAKCEAHGCDFVVLAGDNIYESGVDSVDDPQWQEKFEEPYAALDVPFYAVLGNHDYGGKIFGGTGDQWWKGPIEVDYAAHSDKFVMPAPHYAFPWEHVGSVMLDTNSLMWNNTDHGNQREWYPMGLLEVSDSEWVFAVGHHPYLSNGKHGNAGNYDPIGGLKNPLDWINGKHVKEFLDDVVCGNGSHAGDRIPPPRPSPWREAMTACGSGWASASRCCPRWR